MSSILQHLDFLQDCLTLIWPRFLSFGHNFCLVSLLAFGSFGGCFMGGIGGRRWGDGGMVAKNAPPIHVAFLKLPEPQHFGPRYLLFKCPKKKRHVEWHVQMHKHVRPHVYQYVIYLIAGLKHLCSLNKRRFARNLGKMSSRKNKKQSKNVVPEARSLSWSPESGVKNQRWYLNPSGR